MKTAKMLSKRTLIIVVITLGPPLLSQATRAGQQVEVRAISSRPDAVSGGDVLVQLNASNDVKWNAKLNGVDVTESFRESSGTGKLLALLTGLRQGKNAFEIRTNGAVKAKLVLVNYPLAGPIFSGPHQEPFICQTEANGLGPSSDVDCSAKTLIRYYYKSKDVPQRSFREAFLAAIDSSPTGLVSGFKPYDISAPPPADIATTVTSTGQTVNYIVRRELGVINRAVYDIKFIHQPGEPLPTPWSGALGAWNGRLVYEFIGGCGPGYGQGTLLGAITASQEPMLSQGYAVATATLNIFGNNCNDKVAAETMAMVKEHFIKTYGPPVHTIGVGASSGATQQHLIAQNYPGLLDGIIAEYSFPDMLTEAQSIIDCALLEHAFNSSRQRWTEEQKAAVAGSASWEVCQGRTSLTIGDPTKFCSRRFPASQAPIPKHLIYDRLSNPRGLRCDIYDNEVSVFGLDPKTGFASRPVDNVGVQYGLKAFNTGKINFEQFIELNEKIGGYDLDANFVPERMRASTEAISVAYSRGLVLNGRGLSQIPIIDWRSYADDLGDGHDRFRSFVTRVRLIAANGNADNQVILVAPRVNAFTDMLNAHSSLQVHRERDIPQMDRWLDKIGADGGLGTLSEKVARDKPGLADGCWGADGERIVERATVDTPGRCNSLYPSFTDPRIVAGAPLSDDVLKCELKPIDGADYSQPLTAGQLQRLGEVFPAGVCDFGRTSISQKANDTSTWQKF